MLCTGASVLVLVTSFALSVYGILKVGTVSPHAHAPDGTDPNDWNEQLILDPDDVSGFVRHEDQNCVRVIFRNTHCPPYKDCQLRHAKENTRVLNAVLERYSTNTTVIIGNSSELDLLPGINITNARNMVLSLEGNVNFDTTNGREHFPNYTRTEDITMIRLGDFTNLTIKSDQGARIRGGGRHWYGPLKFLWYGDDRGKSKPVMLRTMKDPVSYPWDRDISTRFTMHGIHFEDPPYWTVYLTVNDVHIHNCSVVVKDKPLECLNVATVDCAFNTDGFDVAGRNVHMHDLYVDAGDDCVANKGGDDWLVENVRTKNCIAMTLGSEGNDAKNVTFRNIVMERPMHALYVKNTRSNVTFENIVATDATSFAPMFGPKYQGISSHDSCSLRFPYFKGTTCAGSAVFQIAMRNVTITSKKRNRPPLFLSTDGRVILENVQLSYPIRAYGVDVTEHDGAAPNQSFTYENCSQVVSNGGLAFDVSCVV